MSFSSPNFTQRSHCYRTFPWKVLHNKLQSRSFATRIFGISAKYGKLLTAQDSPTPRCLLFVLPSTVVAGLIVIPSMPATKMLAL